MRTKGEPDVFLYTHWAGSELPVIVQDALKRGKERWNDAPYLARIVFCEMVKDSINDLTGYGISGVICDNEHPLIVLDTDTQVLQFAREKDGKVGDVIEGQSFDAYCALKHPDYPESET